MTFEEKNFFCLENLTYFVQSGKEIHDSSRCMLEPCFIKCFCDELFSYFNRRRSPHLERSFFLRLCAKYPKAFDDIFLAVRHKKLFLEFFKGQQQQQQQE